MKTVGAAVAGVLMLVIAVALARADVGAAESSAGQEVAGDIPGIESSTSCDYSCIETYEIRCTQAVRNLHVYVGDDYSTPPSRFSDTHVQGQLIGLTPASGGFYGRAVSTPGYLPPGDFMILTLTRPGAEGTMKALAAVQSVSAGDRFYAINAACFSVKQGLYRNTSLIKKFDD